MTKTCAPKTYTFDTLPKTQQSAFEDLKRVPYLGIRDTMKCAPAFRMLVRKGVAVVATDSPYPNTPGFTRYILVEDLPVKADVEPVVIEAECSEETPRNARLSNRLAVFSALDAALFADPVVRPAFDAMYESRFTSYRQAVAAPPAVEMCTCGLCLNDFEAATMSPLDSDATWERAVKAYAFDRTDPLCADCKADCEAEFGGEDDATLHPWDRWDHWDMWLDR